jgi:uncharacterized protein (DUF305 family)
MKITFLLTFVVGFCLACGTATNSSNSPNSTVGSNANHTGSGHSNMEHGNPPAADHNAAGHDMSSSPGAEKAPLELQFLDTMIVHHQGAVDMANLAGSRAQSAEMKELASNIIADQEREIMQLSKWREEWYGEKPKAVNMAFPGMHEGMSGMDMKRLEGLSGKNFDIEFVNQMIPHHEGAITMAKALIAGDARQEVKDLAGDIIRAQTAEIAQMKTWKLAWAVQ